MTATESVVGAASGSSNGGAGLDAQREDEESIFGPGIVEMSADNLDK